MIANRIWLHHFGEPLVATPSDFGARSDEPTHPELLDWLASELIRGDWSLKPLHRAILSSHAYRQRSDDRAEARRIDPHNRLLWRCQRRRLDFESMRDTMLTVSGRLDRKLYGRPVDVAGDPDCRRRTIYGLVDRQQLPGVFRAFDFASPDQSCARRPETIVPQQALFSLNSEFVRRQAEALMRHIDVAAAPDDESRLRALWSRALERDPSSTEMDAALEFLDVRPEAERTEAWVQYAHVLLMTNELHFLD